MRITRERGRRRIALASGGFTLVEAMIACMIAAIMVMALYGSFASGYSMIKVTREDLRATQILLQRLERVRLCTFAQVKDPTINPPTTLEYYDANGVQTGNHGAIYTVTYTASVPSALDLPGVSYQLGMLKVTATATWTSGVRKRSRTMQTYVARDGIQSYVSTGK
jgi:Tfp pilus assembly protein PilV